MTAKSSRQDQQARLVEEACKLPGVAAVLAVYAQAMRVQQPAPTRTRVRYATDTAGAAG